MNLDQFAQAYYQMAGAAVYAKPVPVSPEDTALILIDVQDCLTRDYYEAACRAAGMDMEALAPAMVELEQFIGGTLDNIGKVLNACREKGIRPIHVKIESYLPDGADTGRLHASAGMCYPPNSPTTKFLSPAIPLEGEIVLKKTCSGICVGTPVDRILRNLGVKNVIVVGFYTDQCVSTSVRDLADLGYAVDLIEDATAAMSPARTVNALEGIKKIYANSETTAELLARL